MTPLTLEQAHAVFDLLNAKLGAHWLKRNDFVHHATEEKPYGLEYRFGGKLGFGGKFYNDGQGWRVDCYSEDRNEQSDALVDDANVILWRLREAMR